MFEARLDDNDPLPSSRPALELLLDAKELLDGSLDPEVLSERLARLLVARLCDFCTVDLLEDDGSIGCAALAYRDPGIAEAAIALRARYLAEPDPRRGFRHVIATGVLELRAAITDRDYLAVAEDEEHLRLIRAVGHHSAITAPVSVRERAFGAITVARIAPGRGFDQADLTLVRAIAARAALALDNARLYRAERAARLRAEQAAARLRGLQEVILAVSGASSAERVAALILEHAAAALGATRGIVSALSADGRALEALATIGTASPPEALRQVSVDAPFAIAAAYRRGSLEITETREAYRERFPLGPADEGVVAVPLLASEDRAIGAFVVALDEPRPVSEEERALLDTLARQGGQALDRLRLLEGERRARVAAEEANHAKDEFLGVVSHELRTPLNAILGWAGLLRGKTEPGSMLERGATVIERNARAQAKLIDDILDVSRLIAHRLHVEREPVDLARVLRSTAETIAPAAEAKGLTLEVRVSEPLPEVIGDAARLAQVIGNLVANAVKFTPAGGRVEAALGREGDELRLSVTDTGSGIAAEFLPHVFERFRQADASPMRRHGGLGLGLALARHLVELHGGRVAAESEGEGRGARISVWVPCAPGPAAVTAAQGGLTPRALAGLRVLAVDDEADALEMIAAVLGDRGAEVFSAASASAALAQIDRVLPHVLLSDIGMPITDGYALLAAVRALPGAVARVPAVALTAFARPADVARAAEAGFAAHLPKPIDPEELTRALLRAAGRTPAAA